MGRKKPKIWQSEKDGKWYWHVIVDGKNLGHDGPFDTKKLAQASFDKFRESQVLPPPISSVSLVFTPPSGAAPLSASWSVGVVGGTGPFVATVDFDDDEISLAGPLTGTHVFAEGKHVPHVSVVDAKGQVGEAYSLPVVVTAPATAPTPPLGLYTSDVYGDVPVDVFWQKPASDGNSPVTHYELTVDPARGVVSIDDVHLDAVIAQLPPGSYTIRVYAVNAVGKSNPASVVVTVPEPVPPPPPPPPPPVAAKPVLGSSSNARYPDTALHSYVGVDGIVPNTGLPPDTAHTQLLNITGLTREYAAGRDPHTLKHLWTRQPNPAGGFWPGVVEGDWDASIAQTVEGLPQGAVVILFHEQGPNKGSIADYIAAHRRGHGVIKSVRPDLLVAVCPVGSYIIEGTEDAWWPGDEYVDAIFADHYAAGTTNGTKDFDQLLGAIFAYKPSIPHGIGETATVAANAERFYDSVRVQAPKHPNCIGVFLWLEKGTQGDYRLASLTAAGQSALTRLVGSSDFGRAFGT